MDDHVKLGRRTIQGFKIYGGLRKLEGLLRRFNVDGIVLAITSNVELNRVLKEAERLNLTVYCWKVDRMPIPLGDD